MDLSFLVRFPAALPWVLPPLLGAVIGYVTNAIAIRMLFRPLTKVRFLGLPLPLTPGIIPKQRGQLAESIGQMVSQELLNEEAVRRKLATEDFRGRLEANIGSFLGELLRTPLAGLQKGNQELVASSVEAFLSEALYGFFSSRSFIHGVRLLLGRVVRALGSKQVGQLIGQTEVGTLAVRRLLPLVCEPESKARITKALERWLEARRRGEGQLGGVLPEELTRILADLLETLLPSLLDSLFRWLDRRETREEMNRRGKRLLRTVLEKLNVLQRFLISAGQFDKTLELKMPEIVEEAMSALRAYVYDPDTLPRLRAVVDRAFSGWRSKPTAEVFAAIRPEAAGKLASRMLERAAEPETQKRIAAFIDRVVAGIGGRTFGEILTRYLRIGEQETIELVSNRVLAFLSRKETSQAIAAEVVSFSRRFMEEHRQDSIAGLLHIDAALEQRAARYLTGGLIRIIDARVPALLENFDVRRLVVDKINELEVAQVEKLLLMVIQKHLRWINIFGAILGALIGFSQLLLRLL